MIRYPPDLASKQIYQTACATAKENRATISYQPVGSFAAGLQLGAAELGLSEGGGGEGEGRGGAWDESRNGAGRALKRAGDRGRRRCRRGTGSVAALLVVRGAVARVAAQRARERRRGLGAETQATEGRAHGLDGPEALRLGVEGFRHLPISGALVVRVPCLGVEDLHCVHLADAVAHLAGVHPDGQLSWQVLQDVLDGHAALFRGTFQHRVDGIASLQASER